jgi:hypothetical protein
VMMIDLDVIDARKRTWPWKLIELYQVIEVS